MRGSVSGLVPAGVAGHPEWLPELAGFGSICLPPPRRVHRGAWHRSLASVVGLLVPLLSPVGCGGPVCFDP